MPRYADDLALAHVLADTADSITLNRFRSEDLRVAEKSDRSPVSDADTAVEEAIRATLSRARPRDGILGEEFGQGTAPAGNGSRRWVIDPIDGTKNFVRGVPVWATLIALLDSEDPVAGLVSAPALGRRWWGAKGSGAFAGKHPTRAVPIRVSSVDRLASASLSYSSLSGWEERGLLPGFLDLTRTVWRTRAYGDFFSYVLVAEGAVDVAAEPEVSLWDLAALAAIITEAGGSFTDLAGVPGPAGGSGVATNGVLHDDVLRALKEK